MKFKSINNSFREFFNIQVIDQEDNQMAVYGQVVYGLRCN